MKLVIVAALVSVAAAARLEHLERGYLPPDQSPSQGNFGFGSGIGARSSFGSASQSSFGSHDSNGIDSASAGSQYGSAFPSSSLTQYLPPDHGPSGSGSQFSGSLNGFQRSQPQQQYTPQSFAGSSSQGSFGGASQYNQNKYGSASSSLGQSRYPYNSGSQFPSASRQYLAPKSNFQDIPQQAFDEQTGYHY